MSVALISGIDVNLKWQYTNPLDLSTPSNQQNLEIIQTLASGTGLNQANRMFEDTRTLASAGDDALDLSGSLVDAFGNTLALTRVVGFYIHNHSVTAGDILTIGNGSNPFINWVGSGAHTVKVGPNGVLLIWNPSAAGYAVTATTGDILNVHNSGSNSIIYDIVVFGSQ